MSTAYELSERPTGNRSPRGNNRQRLLEAIAELEYAVPEDVNTLAIRLSTKFPQSGLTIDEICRRIEAAFNGGHESAERA